GRIERIDGLRLWSRRYGGRIHQRRIKLKLHVGACREVDLRLREDGERQLEHQQSKVRIRIQSGKILEAAGDRSLQGIGAANAVDNPVDYRFARIVDGGYRCHDGQWWF